MTPHPFNSRSHARLLCALLLLVASACNSAPQQCLPVTTGSVQVVMTFDDGPLAADIADKTSATPEALLGPLNDILATLKTRGIQAVFFVAGPGTDDAANQLSGTFADGLTSIHQAGHILGYHAFHHVEEIYANPLLLPPLAESAMMADLDRLENFIADSLAPRGATAKDFFQPLFRQPYGGAGVLAFEGLDVAKARGWAYHGFRVDSGDWLVNSEVDPHLRKKLFAQTDDDLKSFVTARLQAGGLANLNCGQADVLCHVNSFTAKHLSDWIDQIQTSTTEPAGRAAILDVPQSYVQTTDSFVDTTLVDEVLTQPGG